MSQIVESLLSASVRPGMVAGSRRNSKLAGDIATLLLDLALLEKYYCPPIFLFPRLQFDLNFDIHKNPNEIWIFTPNL